MPATDVVLTELQPIFGIAPASINAASTSSAAIDLVTYDGVFPIVFAVGAIAAASTGITITTDPASGGAFTTLAYSGPLLTSANNNSTQVTYFDCRNCQRFIKLNIVQNTPAAGICGASIVAFKKVK